MPAWLFPKSLSTYVIVALVILSGLMSWLYSQEKSSHKRTVREYIDFVAKTQALGEIQLAKNAADEARRKLITETIVNSHKESENQLEEYYAKNPNIRYITIASSVHDDKADTSSSEVPREAESARSTNKITDGIDEAVAGSAAEEISIDAERVGREIIQFLELIKFTKQQ